MAIYATLSKDQSFEDILRLRTSPVSSLWASFDAWRSWVSSSFSIDICKTRKYLQDDIVQGFQHLTIRKPINFESNFVIVSLAEVVTYGKDKITYLKSIVKTLDSWKWQSGIDDFHNLVLSKPEW